MFVWSLLSMFGLMIAHRTLSVCEELKLVSGKSIPSLRAFVFLGVISLNLVFKNNLSALKILSICMWFAPLLAKKAIVRYREKQFIDEFVPNLDILVLSMKSGKSFRQSLQSNINSMSEISKMIMTEFLSAIQFQKMISEITSNKEILFFLSELQQVDSSSHMVVERLKSLRAKLMIQRSFRQKSSQALIQIKAQSWIISAMYLCLLMFVNVQFGFEKNFKTILTSAIFFVFGFIWINRAGRKYKWKI